MDRISSLPDEVLTHILSFLTTRQSVRTCILSKRWRNTWTSVPILKFDFSEFQSAFPHFCDNCHDNFVLKFDRFVSSVFENREPSHLDTVMFFEVYGKNFWEPSLRWLHCAALSMPRVINADITTFDGEELYLPDSLFSCASLENLHLCHDAEIGKPKIIQNSIALASLKELSLGNLYIVEDFTQKLLMGCPALENLEFYDCDLYVPHISSNVLKELTITSCCLDKHLQISCPILVSLFIKPQEYSERGVISLVNMTALVTASIRSSITYDIDEDLQKSKFLSGLSNVTSLHLYFDQHDLLMDLWEQFSSHCVTFFNLKSLEIGAWNMIDDFSMVACFLQHCPVLKQLTLYLDNEPHVILEIPREEVPFQCEYLETVNVCMEICLEEKLHLAAEMITVLGRHIKTIGNLNISEYKYFDIF